MSVYQLEKLGYEEAVACEMLQVDRKGYREYKKQLDGKGEKDFLKAVPKR